MYNFVQNYFQKNVHFYIDINKKYENPKTIKKHEKKLAKKQRQLAHKKK